MTRQRSFKRLVRARMEKTGESYAAARAMLLAADDRDRSAPPPLPTSDDTIRQRTGLGWEKWFDLLDEWGAQERSHREIARWVAGKQGVDPLAWNAQAVTKGYERARHGRAVGERDDGFAITASRTVATPVERVFDAFTDPVLRRQWLPDAPLRERTATRPRSARFDWGGGPGRVHVTFTETGASRANVAVEHIRLADARRADQMKRWWRTHLDALKARLEDGEADG